MNNENFPNISIIMNIDMTPIMGFRVMISYQKLNSGLVKLLK